MRNPSATGTTPAQLGQMRPCELSRGMGRGVGAGVEVGGAGAAAVGGVDAAVGGVDAAGDGLGTGVSVVIEWSA